MPADAATDPLARGEAALKTGDWEEARSGFEAALDHEDTPEAHDGLGRALWWLGDLTAALEHREAAYAGLRRRGDSSRAARIALWLSREYLEAVGNDPASNGWVARAHGLLRDADECVEHGWLELVRGDRTLDPTTMRRHAQSALDVGRRFEDADLDASALALLGRASILEGDLEGGMTALDEAMAAATGGEVDDPLVFGDICCIVTRACEEAGEMGRLMRWNEVVMSYLERNHHAPLIQFCGTCGAEAFLSMGDVATAEACLIEAIRALEGTGHRSRCIQPNTKLAELRVLQGRIEEAERLLIGSEDLPEAIRASVAIHRIKGEHAVAVALLLRRLNRVGETVLAVPLLSSLVEVQIEHGDLAGAASSAERLSRFADRSGHPRVVATAALAQGRVGAVAGDPEARSRFEEALEIFGQLEMQLDAARTRVELARLLRDAEPEIAAREARLALETFERVGAARDADEAAALVRALGGPARTGPKAIGLLSRREREVLALLGEGLTNAEIAARLYISTKTAGNHVSSVLSKLNLRSRSEAAVYAVRYPAGSSATG